MSDLPEWWKSDKPWIIGDCIEVMAEMPDECIDLVVTSPPYNVGINYGEVNDNLPFNEYIEWLSEVWTGCYRILKDGGRIAVNIGDNGRNPCNPTHAYVIVDMCEIGFVNRGMIIWDKQNCLSNTAWGSWMSPSNPALRSRSEYILIFNKGNMSLQHKGKPTITRDEFIEYTMGTWNITPETRYKDHPCPFPIELPKRIIKLYAYEDDIVFDPFLGSGTTLKACRLTDRIGLGCEINPDYEEIIRKRSMDDIKKIEDYGR